MAPRGGDPSPNPPLFLPPLSGLGSRGPFLAFENRPKINLKFDPDFGPEMAPKMDPGRPPRQPKCLPKRVPLSDPVLVPQMVHFWSKFGPFWLHFLLISGLVAGLRPETLIFNFTYKTQWIFNVFKVAETPSGPNLVQNCSLEGSFWVSRFVDRF